MMILLLLLSADAPDEAKLLRSLLEESVEVRDEDAFPFKVEKLSGTRADVLWDVAEIHRQGREESGPGGRYETEDTPQRVLRFLEALGTPSHFDLLPKANRSPAKPGRKPDERVLRMFPLPAEAMATGHQEEARLALNAAMRRIPGPEAAQVLARRSVFDPSAKVRADAREAIRDKAAVRPILLAALRHPWAPAAAHAAEALERLGDRAALPALKAMLELPPPEEPFRDGSGRWMKRELVRIDHVRNCVLCHAAYRRVPPALLQREPAPLALAESGYPKIRPSPGSVVPKWVSFSSTCESFGVPGTRAKVGLIASKPFVAPRPGVAKPLLFAAGEREPPGKGKPGKSEPVVRAVAGEKEGVDASVVRLRAEFSARHVRASGPKRFDYLTRVRALTDEERKAHLMARAEPRGTYPQREAVRAAIRRLEALR